MNKRTIVFTTLGCKLNQYETDALASKFNMMDWNVIQGNSDSLDNIDCQVINTCTVTNKADRKSRNAIYRLHRRSDAQKQNSQKPILTIITGCFPENHNDKISIEKAFQDDYTIIVLNQYKSYIPDIVEAYFAGEIIPLDSLIPDHFGYKTDTSNRLHTRATIKIQEGCDNFCSYCIIPYVRGSATSRPLPDILAEAEHLIKSGFLEIILTGINISRYEWEGKGLSDLLESLVTMDGIFRIRISSLEPDNLDHKLLQIIAHPKICRHIHLCLQSGSDKILSAMKRVYNFQYFCSAVQKIRKIDRFFNITTDIIVGFPGETFDDFNASLKAIQILEFGDVHVFPYSTRNGTVAAKLPGQIDNKEKKSRAAEIQKIADRKKLDFYNSMVGETLFVLVEKEFEIDQQKFAYGYSDNYCPVYIEIQENTIVYNQLIETHINDASTQGLKGKLIKKPVVGSLG